ncbi:MAG: hypothetical protein E7277_04830 [Lachnospiraceae bacterium]|nr:hypothetical protein [Lachnospiraceae bacterium]
MLRDSRHRKQNLIIAGIIIVLGIAYSIFGEHETEKLSMPEEYTKVVVQKLTHEEVLSKKSGKVVYELLKNATIKKSEGREKIEKEEYPETYSIGIYKGKSVMETYYLLPDGRIYAPADRKVHTLKKDIQEEMKEAIGF